MKNLSLTSFLNERNNLLPNIDPDGLFTYAIIKKYIPCDIVGFTNSKDHVYLIDGKENGREKVTYIDMYVSDKTIQSIDQHIICRNNADRERILSFNTKLNPNLYVPRDLSNYTQKFPYSTFIWVSCILSNEYDVTIDWHRKITDDLELGHLILDIDGVLTNLVQYKENCYNWLKILNETFNNRFIKELSEYITSIEGEDLILLSKNVRAFLKDNFLTETTHGGYKSINRKNLIHISKLGDFIFDLFDIKDIFFKDINSQIKDFHGVYCISDCTEQVMINEAIFSYAIVSRGRNNFSFTLKPTNYKWV